MPNPFVSRFFHVPPEAYKRWLPHYSLTTLAFSLVASFHIERDLMETTEIRGLHVDTSSTVEGGVEDAYGEDRATEDQLVTPWTVSVARFDLL